MRRKKKWYNFFGNPIIETGTNEMFQLMIIPLLTARLKPFGFQAKIVGQFDLSNPIEVSSL